MSSRRIRPLRAVDLDSLPEPCLTCSFWESKPGRTTAGGPELKTTWAETVTDHWGLCGFRAVADGHTIGYLTMAPAPFVPRLGPFATGPVSPDAAVVMAVRVVDGFTGRGIGRQLVQSAASFLARRDIVALEAVGTYRDAPCLLPVGWLESVGFAVVRDHPLTPRLRMNLQTTVRWSLVGEAWHRLGALVRQPAPPEPAGFDAAHRQSAVARPRVPQLLGER